MNWDSITFAIPRHLPSRETRPVSSTDETQLIRSVSVSPLIKFLSPCPDCRLCLVSSGTPSRGNGTLIILFIPMQILITMAVTQQQENICKTTIRGVTPLLIVVVRKDTLAVTLFAKNFPTINGCPIKFKSPQYWRALSSLLVLFVIIICVAKRNIKTRII